MNNFMIRGTNPDLVRDCTLNTPDYHISFQIMYFVADYSNHTNQKNGGRNK